MAYNVLDDVETVFATAEVIWIWSEDLLARLAELRPHIYAKWGTEILGRNLVFEYPRARPSQWQR